MKDFIRGMTTLTLFPQEPINVVKKIQDFKIMSDTEAFQYDLQAVGNDMWNAIKIVQKEHPELL